MIVVYGGSQIDAGDRPSARFPEQRVDEVRRRIRAQLEALQPRLIVGSAASGTDLLVLEAARAENIAADVVLPFSIARFLETSVASRGDAWRERFDRLVDPKDVEILGESDDDEVYHRTNAALLERAAARADAGEPIVALVVRPRLGQHQSVSDDLAERAIAKGYRVIDIDPRGR
jgi:hypothetical protein